MEIQVEKVRKSRMKGGEGGGMSPDLFFSLSLLLEGLLSLAASLKSLPPSLRSHPHACLRTKNTIRAASLVRRGRFG